MSMLKLPPETTERRAGRPARRLPPHLGCWQFMVQTDTGRLRLAENRRGVNLFWRRVRGDHLCASLHMYDLLNLYRGLRTIQRGERVFERYDILETDDPDEYFVCALPPGHYHITPRADAEGEVLWVYDPCYIDDRTIATPRLPPELRGLVRVRERPLASEVRKPVIAKATLTPKPLVRARLHEPTASKRR